MKRRMLFSVVLSFAGLFALLAAVGGVAQASVPDLIQAPTVCSPAIVVTSPLDSGAGTLRQAIADVCAEGTITFAGDYTITLGSELTISQSLFLDGLGRSITLSGGGTSRVFSVTASATFTLQHLIVTQGYADQGGGLYNNGGVVVITATRFFSNSASNMGGGIYNFSGTLTLQGSTLAENAAPAGGGLFNYYSALTVQNSTLVGNRAEEGGGILSNYALITLTHSTLSENLASTRSGGGLHVNHGVVLVQNSTLAGNSAANYMGGGIYNNDVRLTVANSTFTGNSARWGGGINNFTGTVLVQNSTFYTNAAVVYGGGILNSNLLTVSNSTFSENSAVVGGGLFVSGLGLLVVQNSTLSGNAASSSGDGIYNNNASLDVSNTVIANSVHGEDCSGAGTFNVSDHNLMEATGNNACDLISGVDGSLTGIDPLLAPLGDYGGATQTFALLPGSRAINAGNAASCLPIDQRGRGRVGACDMGAYESQGFTLTKADGDHQATTLNTAFARPLRVTLSETGASGLPGAIITFTAPLNGASLALPIVVTATTDRSGSVAIAVTANNTLGLYPVTASAADVVTTTFTLMNARQLFLPLINQD